MKFYAVYMNVIGITPDYDNKTVDETVLLDDYYVIEASSSMEAVRTACAEMRTQVLQDFPKGEVSYDHVKGGYRSFEKCIEAI